MKPLKILLVSSEVAPFAKTGGLADVAGSLPSALKSSGCNVKVFTPFYRETKKGNFKTELVEKDIEAELGGSNFIFSLYRCKRDGVDFYFIDREKFFDRDFLYGTPSGDYSDNDIRFAFFEKEVIKREIKINFKKEIIQ